MTRRFLPVITTLLFLTNLCLGQQQPLKLWYDKPAQVWEETLPLGNGRLGMMPDGGVAKENIVLNDITLWSGAEQDANNYNAYKALPEIRKLLLEGKNDEAQAVINKDFICTGAGSGSGSGAKVPFGCYQVLGNLSIQFKYSGSDSAGIDFKNYERELSLNKAVAKCTYQVNGVNYTREYFTSFGNDVSIVKLTADKPGALNCSISISRPERGTAAINGDELQLSGQLDNGTDGKGMEYLARVKAKLKGGTVSTSNSTLVIKGATEAIIYISAGTNFKDKSFKKKTGIILDAAIKSPYAAEKQHHITNYQKLFNRVNISLGDANNTRETTDKRLISFHKAPSADNGLPVLFFQYGRYLSICSTRVGLLPPNLQGLWANQIQTPWNGDYHLDINVQMNHWPLEVANLSELNLPLVELVRGLIKNGEKTAKAYYNGKGWVAHVVTNPWHFTEPGEEASWGISKSGSGWLCNNIWEHYTLHDSESAFRQSRLFRQSFHQSGTADPHLKGWHKCRLPSHS